MDRERGRGKGIERLTNKSKSKIVEVTKRRRPQSTLLCVLFCARPSQGNLWMPHQHLQQAGIYTATKSPDLEAATRDSCPASPHAPSVRISAYKNPPPSWFCCDLRAVPGVTSAFLKCNLQGDTACVLSCLLDLNWDCLPLEQRKGRGAAEVVTSAALYLQSSAMMTRNDDTSRWSLTRIEN